MPSPTARDTMFQQANRAPRLDNVSDRIWRTVEEVLRAIPESSHYARSPEFTNSVKKVMFTGWDGVTESEKYRLKKAIENGLLPGDVAYKAWENAYPTEEHKLELQNKGIFAQRAAEKIAMQVVGDLAKNEKTKPIIEGYFQGGAEAKPKPEGQTGQSESEGGSQDAGLAEFFDQFKIFQGWKPVPYAMPTDKKPTGERPRKGGWAEQKLADWTDELIKAAGYDESGYPDKERFINLAKPADIQKFKDADAGERFGYIMGTLAGYGTRFMTNVISFMGHLPEQLSPETEKPDKAASEGEKTHNLLDLVYGMVRPVENWTIMLGLNTAYPIGSERWQQALREFWADPVTHSAIVSEPIRRMRNMYQKSLERPADIPSTPDEVVDAAKAKVAVLEAETVLEKAKESGNETQIQYAETALENARQEAAKWEIENQELLDIADLEFGKEAPVEIQTIRKSEKALAAKRAQEEALTVETETGRKIAGERVEVVETGLEFGQNAPVEIQSIRKSEKALEINRVLEKAKALGEKNPWDMTKEEYREWSAGFFGKIAPVGESKEAGWSQAAGNRNFAGGAVSGPNIAVYTKEGERLTFQEALGREKINLNDVWQETADHSTAIATATDLLEDAGYKIADTHKAEIQARLELGLDVPDERLAEYPDLNKKYVQGEAGVRMGDHTQKVKDTKVETGLESADVSRNLAHQKAKVLTAEQALETAREKGADKSIIDDFERQLAEERGVEADLQKQFDAAKEKLAEETDIAEIPPEGPPPESPGKILGDINSTPPVLIGRIKKLGLTAGVRTPSNLMGAIPGQPARYGRSAQYVQRALNLTERDIMINTGIEGEVVAQILGKVDKADWGKKGEKFYDLYEKIVNPEETIPEGVKQSTIDAAKELNRFLEGKRNEAVQIMRDRVRPWVSRIVENQFRQENNLVGVNLEKFGRKAFEKDWREQHGLKGKKLKPEERAALEDSMGERQAELDAYREQLAEYIEETVEQMIPEDWGIDYYLPQMHPGSYNVYITIEDVAGAAEEGPSMIGQYVGTGRTRAEAKEIVTRDLAERRERGDAVMPENYQIKEREFRGSENLRVSDPRFFKVINDLADKAGEFTTREDIIEAFRGTVGRKSSRQKFAGFMQKREAGGAFSKDVSKVMAAYIQTFNRWKYLTELNRQVQPIFDKIRKAGNESVAQYLENELSYLWGETGSKVSQQFDASLQGIPFLRDHIRPMALERWARYVKTPILWTYLRLNLRFHLLNRSQTFQTLAPDVTAKEFFQGRRFYLSKEGKEMMAKYGLRFLRMGKLREAEGAEGWYSWPGKAGEKIAKYDPETFNQEVAWCTFFKKAKDMGMSDAAANDYAFLKGNIHSQFLYLRTDMPSAIRGPITSTMFMFRRFQIKNIELGMDLLQSRNYPGVTKWLGSQLLFGGTRAITKGTGIGAAAGVFGIPLPYIEADMYNDIKKEHGEYMADLVAFGLPGLIGLDMSYSIMLLDTPYGESVAEKIGNFAMGPPGQLVANLYRAYGDTKGMEDNEWQRVFNAAVRKIPALKWMDALQAIGNKVETGQYMFTDPAGRGRFKADLKDVIVRAMGGRTSEEAEIDIFTEAVLWVVAERDDVTDKMTHAAINEDWDKFNDLWLGWWEKWPEFPISKDGLRQKYTNRVEGATKDKFERVIDNAGKAFMSSEFYLNRMMEDIEKLKEHYDETTSIDRSRGK